MSLTVKIKGDASQFDKTMRGVKATVGGLSSKIGAIGTAAAGAAAGYVTLSKAMEFLQSSSQKAAGMEDLQISLVTLTGSASSAKKTLKELSDIADKSTFGVDVYADAAKLLIGFGVSADDAIPVLRNLADISMGNQEKFSGLALAFGQAAAGGRLMKEEVNQMIERGFNPLQIIAQRTGESMGDLLKRVSAGGVSIDELKKSMADATGEGGRFNNAMNNAMDTTNGKISMVGKSINKLQIAFGTGFNVGLKNALDATNNFLPQLEARFTDAGELLGAALTDAISGDMRKFQVIGEFIGAILAQGVASGFEKYVMGTIEGVLVDYAEFFQNADRRAAMATKNKLMDMAMAQSDPAAQKAMAESIMNDPLFQDNKPMIRQLYTQGAEYQKIGAPSLAERIRPELEALQFEQGMTNAMSKSITRDMPRAVREGILEGQRQAREKATFSN